MIYKLDFILCPVFLLYEFFCNLLLSTIKYHNQSLFLLFVFFKHWMKRFIFCRLKVSSNEFSEEITVDIDWSKWTSSTRENQHNEYFRIFQHQRLRKKSNYVKWYELHLFFCLNFTFSNLRANHCYRQMNKHRHQHNLRLSRQK